MSAETRTFVVAKKPPWYLTGVHKEVFSCENTEGLFMTVMRMMTMKQQELSEREKRSEPKIVYNIIRNKVIQDAHALPQRPSRPLLRALMDLVDIEGGNKLESIASVDRAGYKHALLAHSNFTGLHIPIKELTSTNGKKVIPVVTQVSYKHNLLYCDSSRSMVATYSVLLQRTEKCKKNTYFVQEVLFVPGLESLEVLKKVTDDKFEFWDMALEVPTHITALTPTFQQIQPCQLLRTDAATQSNNEALVSHLEEMNPMCCVVDPGTAHASNNSREAPADCFSEHQVICDLKPFRYENGDPRTVYFRRTGKQNRVNMVPLVKLRKGQAGVPELYVSTTLRFCRAVKQCCFKGSGDLVSGWNYTLRALDRETFITGPEVYHEIHNLALAAFIKRVDPTSWCNYTPKHVESMIQDPVKAEIVHLGIKFMACKIPHAFPVAELLYCPIEKVREYVDMWCKYKSDKTVRTAVRKNRIRIVQEQMRVHWVDLSTIVSKCARLMYGEDERLVDKACDELLEFQTQDDVAKAQKMWNSLVKQSANGDKDKDKDLVRMCADAKVIFLKLCTYHSKLKKGLKVGERERSDSHGGSSCSSHSYGDCDLKDEDAYDAEDNEPGKDRPADVASAKTDVLYSIVTPERIPLSGWLKNLSTLLLCTPWLYEEVVRREAVCTLLGLDETLLDRRYSATLREWVIDNRTVVVLLRNHRPEDRLSKALLNCLESTSSDNWTKKIVFSFKDRLANKPYRKMSVGGGQPAATKDVGRWTERKRKAPKQIKPTASISEIEKKSRDRSSCTCLKDKHHWLSEAQEALSEEEESDDGDGEDEDNGCVSLSDTNDSEEEDEEEDSERSGITFKAVKRDRECDSVSDSEAEDEKWCCGGAEEYAGGGFKRKLSSDSDALEPEVKPEVKRVKRPKCQMGVRREEKRGGAGSSTDHTGEHKTWVPQRERGKSDNNTPNPIRDNAVRRGELSESGVYRGEDDKHESQDSARHQGSAPPEHRSPRGSTAEAKSDRVLWTTHRREGFKLESEQRRPREKSQKGGRERVDTREPARSPEPQDFARHQGSAPPEHRSPRGSPAEARADRVLWTAHRREGFEPGPQSVHMIAYLERLANGVCMSQLEEPCSSEKLSCTYSNPGRNVEEAKVVHNTLDRYFVKK